MKSRFCFVLFVLFFLHAYMANAELVQGVVFHDMNGNGVQDPGEPVLAGIAVSNGEEVTLTGANGHYALEMTDAGVVFVIKPSGWTSPLNPETNIAQFHYVHRPEGSPPLRHGGVPPTGQLPHSMNFPLRPQHEPDHFRILCLGDTQPRNLDEVHYLAQDLVAETAGMDAAFGITLGDLVFDDLSVFEPIAQCIGQIGLPWHHVPGNHDMDFDAPTWQQTFETYQRVFGPPYYAFAYANTHVFVLNNIRWNVDERKYHAELGERQRRFIENYLAYVPKDHFVLFTMHIPVMNMEDRDAFFELIAPFPNTLSLSAHRHRHEHFFLDAEQGWPGDAPHHHIVHGTAGGAWYRGHFDAVGIPEAVMADGTPKGYSIITIKEGKYDVQYRATRRPVAYQMDIHAPMQTTLDSLGENAVVVNFFNGTERCRVELRLNDGPWTPMERFSGKAPFYEELAARQQLFAATVAGLMGIEATEEVDMRHVEQLFRPVIGRGMPDPADTNHLWRVLLPEGARPGYNRIEARAHDMFGHTHTARRYIMIAE